MKGVLSDGCWLELVMVGKGGLLLEGGPGGTGDEGWIGERSELMMSAYETKLILRLGVSSPAGAPTPPMADEVEAEIGSMLCSPSSLNLNGWTGEPGVLENGDGTDCTGPCPP